MYALPANKYLFWQKTRSKGAKRRARTPHPVPLKQDGIRKTGVIDKKSIKASDSNLPGSTFLHRTYIVSVQIQTLDKTPPVCLHSGAFSEAIAQDDHIICVAGKLTATKTTLLFFELLTPKKLDPNMLFAQQ